jgi:hypothetical protein
MKKLILFFLIIIVLYIIAIFKFPQITDHIAYKFGIENFNEAVVNIKKVIDGSATQTI